MSVLSLFATVSEEGPVLCVVDDTQWLDRASVQALAFVARRLLADSVGLVFATRQREADLASFPELVVDGLADADAQTLLSTVLRAPLDERVRDRIVAEARGNPLALVEWPRGLTPAELAGGFGLPAALPMSSKIEENYRRRITKLPARTQRFLTVAAAEPTGDPVVVWRAATNLGVAADDAVPAIEAGLVEIGIRVSFRHPLARSAAYAGTALADRQAAHRELAQVTDPYLDPDRRAWHGALGSPGPDEQIADALEQSADRARARGGLAAAAALLERSVALTLDLPRRHARILAAAAAHLESGSFQRCASLLTAAEATNLDDMGQAQVDLLRARQAVFGGAIREAPDLLLRAAKRFEPLDVGRAAETYLAAQAAVSVAGTSARGVTTRDVARAALRCPMPTVRTTREWLVTGLAQVVMDGPAAAAPALRQALNLAPDSAVAGHAIHWLGYQAGAALALWDISNAHKLASLHVDRTRQLGALTMLPVALNTLAHIFVLQGDLGAAATSLGEAQPIVEATGSSILPHGGAILAGWRGDADALGMLSELVERAGTEGNAFARMSAQCAIVVWCNGMGRYKDAVAVATQVVREHWVWSAHMLFHELIEAAARTGQSAVASRTLGRLKETTETSGTDWAIGVQRRSEAVLSEGTAAEGAYREAIDRLGRTQVRPELARAHLLYGEWLRREKQRLDARTHLRAAYEMFTAMGIQAFAQRTRRELLATGERKRKRTTDSLDELTPQEANIAHLAAAGRRTRRSAPSSSSARARSNFICARSLPSSISLHDANSARPCRAHSFDGAALGGRRRQ
jgi:hypothetical protein